VAAPVELAAALVALQVEQEVAVAARSEQLVEQAGREAPSEQQGQQEALVERRAVRVAQSEQQARSEQEEAAAQMELQELQVRRLALVAQREQSHWLVRHWQGLPRASHSPYS
jgi:hypothetical protein